MGRVLKEIGPSEEAFILKQRLFFVATAPLSSDHRVSVSPKANRQPTTTTDNVINDVDGGEKKKEGGEGQVVACDDDGSRSAVAVLGPHEVAYADLTGSGSETASHVMENGRMTLMFCNLEQGPPKILRLYGTASVVLAEDVPMALKDKFDPAIVNSDGFRAVYRLRVDRISTSCGYTLPVMKHERYRSTLMETYDSWGKAKLDSYSTERNAYSIDGLPSLALCRKDGPGNLQPVLENGFYMGKQLDGVDGVINSTKNLLLRRFSGNCTTIRLHHALLAVVSSLVLGIAIGIQVRSSLIT